MQKQLSSPSHKLLANATADHQLDLRYQLYPVPRLIVNIAVLP